MRLNWQMLGEQIHASQCQLGTSLAVWNQMPTNKNVGLCVCACIPHPFQGAQLQPIQVPLSYLQQSIFGPLTEPVNGGAADERWVLEDTFPVGNQTFMNIIQI